FFALLLGWGVPTLRGYRLFSLDFLAGPGLGLALLALAFLCAYLGQADTSEGLGYWVAVGIGVVGAAAAVFAVARATAPGLLYEGPAAIRKPNGDIDRWAAVGRAVLVLLAIGIAAVGLVRRLSV